MIKNINRNLILEIKKFGFVISYVLSCNFFVQFFSDTSLAKTVEVSESVRDSIIEFNEGFDECLDSDYSNNDNEVLVDEKINTSSLKRVRFLRIDGSNCGNLQFLKYSPNLLSITIDNFECLSLEDMKYISEIPRLREIHVIVSGDYLLKNPNYKPDLSIFNHIDDVYLYVFSSRKVNDISNFLLYNVGKDYYNSTRANIFDKSMDAETLNKVRNWDEQFDKMMSKIPISSNDNEEDKIMQIVYFINDYYDYDDEVSGYLRSGEENSQMEDLILKYNINLIEPIFSKNREGICCNFTAFTNILCYKAGLESYYISGLCMDMYNNSVGHAWNLVNVLDNYYIVDTTVLENNISYEVFSSLERGSQEKDSWYDAVLSEILCDLNGKAAILYDDVYGYTDTIISGDNIVKPKENIVYFNSDDGKSTIDFPNKTILWIEIIGGCLTGIIAVCDIYSIHKSENKIKKKKLEK